MYPGATVTGYTTPYNAPTRMRVLSLGGRLCASVWMCTRAPPCEAHTGTTGITSAVKVRHAIMGYVVVDCLRRVSRDF